MDKWNFFTGNRKQRDARKRNYLEQRHSDGTSRAHVMVVTKSKGMQYNVN